MKYWNILRKLRSQASKKRIPALVTTIIAEKKVEFYYRIHDFLIKPVVASELLSALLFAGVTAENIRSILIVDNDQSAIDHLRTILQELGYRTICESKPSTALQVVKKEHPDVIVLDPIMLGAEGFNFLYALRKSEITRYTPIVILTRKNLTDDEYSNLQNFTQRVVLRGTGSIEDLVSEFQSILPISDYERQII
jgi:CheY-like chemotaxis protein